MSRASLTTAAGRPSGAEARRGNREVRKSSGALHGTERPARPAGWGDALFHAEEPAREEALSTGSARQGSPEADGVRHAAPREAEGPGVLRGLREAVQAGLRQGYPDAGRERREPPQAHGAQSGQRRLPDGLRDEPAAGAATRLPRALSPERAQAQHPIGYFAFRRC